jgi:hypothetical protein
MPVFITANNNDCIPNGLLEFDWTKQSGAVSFAELSKPIVCGAEGSSPSKQSGMEPLIFAVALARKLVGENVLMKGVYCFSTTT